MRWLSWILLLPLCVAVVVFSISNRTVIKVDLWPLAYIVELPVFAIMLVSLLFGFVLGGVIAWTSGAKNRSKARSVARDATSARRELSALRQEARNKSGKDTEKTNQIIPPQETIMPSLPAPKTP